MLVVGSIVIRVNDLPRQIRFWSEALNYAARETVDVDFALLSSADGRGPNVSLDAVPAPRVLPPPRIHLDLYAENQQAEVERLTRLGASEVHWNKRPADADYVIMQDPEGNRFCVIDASEWAGWTHRSPETAAGGRDSG